jgi:fucose permease
MPNSKITRRQYILLVVVLYGTNALHGFIQGLKGVALPLIKNAFDVSYNTQGLMVSLIAVTAVVAVAVAGIVIGRTGFKKALFLGFALVVLGMGSMFFAPVFWAAAAFFFTIQMGLGFFDIGLNGMAVRIFTVRSALMLSLQHFCFGVGSIIGPWFAGRIANLSVLPEESSWRLIHPFALIPVFVMVIIALFTPVLRPAETNGSEKAGFLAALKRPMVWTFGIIIGFTSAIEAGSINWSGLYLQDVYGLDPGVAGAAFVSAFFLCYTISRLISGFVIEKIGYLNGLLFSSFAMAVIFIAGFLLGERGIWLLPVTGFFLAVIWPTIFAVSVGLFKEQAQAMSGAIITIGFTLSGIIQYLIGLINRFIGEAWGYRTCIVYSVILAVTLFLLRRELNRRRASAVSNH